MKDALLVIMAGVPRVLQLAMALAPTLHGPIAERAIQMATPVYHSPMVVSSTRAVMETVGVLHQPIRSPMNMPPGRPVLLWILQQI